MLNSTARRIGQTALAIPFALATATVVASAISLANKRDKVSTYFRQQRTGLHANKISVTKFKSMRDNENLPDEDRFTRIGRLIRKTSIDELPQFFNVISGDLDVVGPRPLKFTPEELFVHFETLIKDPKRNLSEERQNELLQEVSGLIKRLYSVKPGITGFAQISKEHRGQYEGFNLDKALGALRLDDQYISLRRTLPHWRAAAVDLNVTVKTAKFILTTLANPVNSSQQVSEDKPNQAPV